MSPAGLLIAFGVLFGFVLAVSFMFRALALLRDIRDSLQRSEEAQELAAKADPAHHDPDIAAHLARKRMR